MDGNFRARWGRTSSGFLAAVALLAIGSARPALGQTIFSDNFSGAANAAVTGQQPGLADLPGATWQGSSDLGFASYAGGNEMLMYSLSAGVVLATSSGQFPQPVSMTVSAGLQDGNLTDGPDGGPSDYSVFRGLGLGFATFTTGYWGLGTSSGFQGLALNVNGTVSLVQTSAPGSTQNNQTETLTTVTPNYYSVFGASFSPSVFYNLSYTINTLSGVISNISLTSGTTTDTADFASLDGLTTTITGVNASYVGVFDSSFGVPGDGVIPSAYVQNFLVTAPATAFSIWTGASSSSWSDAGNWNNTVAGSTTGATSTATALFNQAVPNSPLTIDAGRNLQNITFDTAAVNALTIGATSGPALLLTSGGEIEMTATVVNPQVIVAPLVLEGTGGTYGFGNNSSTAAATLTFNGPITAGASSGTTTLTLSGANAGANVINGIIGNGTTGATLALAASGSNWTLTAANTYTGPTTITAGKLTISGTGSIAKSASISIGGSGVLDLTGSTSQLGGLSVNVVNNSTAAAGLVIATTAPQSIGQLTGTGNTVVGTTTSAGNLTAYQIVQNSLTIDGTSKATGMVALLPSGSGSTTNPTGPNNINYSSTLTSLTIANNGAAPGIRVYYGALDIGNNGLVIAYGSAADPYMWIDDMIRSGFDSGHWDGGGITSSVGRAAAESHTPLNIGLIDFTPGAGNFSNSTFIVFEGQTVTTDAILVRLTYMDDINSLGDMSVQDAASDALIFAANYGSGTTWSVGDLTHDGTIGSADALLFAANYVTGLPSLDGTTGSAVGLASADGAAGGLGAVPEPKSIILASLGALGMGLFARRRRPR